MEGAPALRRSAPSRWDAKRALRAKRRPMARLRSWVMRSSLLVVGLGLVVVTMAGSEARRRLAEDDDDDGCCDGADKTRADPTWTTPFYVAGIVYMFLALAIVCDEYFVPALEEMAEDMQLSLDMAGATLMAAGGSAPELFTSFVATFKESDLGFGTIVGSAVFNILFVIGVCASAAPAPLVLTWWPLLRDCSYYAVSLAVLAYFFVNTEPARIEWWESVTLFCMYLGYLLVMWQNRNLHWLFLSRVLGRSDAECRLECDDAPGGFGDGDGDVEQKAPAAGRRRSSMNARTKCLSGRFRAGVFTILTERKTMIEMAGIAAVTRIVGGANETFDRIDADGSGKIDRAELEDFLAREGVDSEALTPDALARAVEAMDGNGDGEITRAAFVAWYASCEQRVLSETRRCWEMFDLNGDGRLDASEIVHVLRQLGDDDADEVAARGAIDDIKRGSVSLGDAPGDARDARDASSAGLELKDVSLDDDAAPRPLDPETSVSFDEFKSWFAATEYFEAKTKATQAVVAAQTASDDEANGGGGPSLAWPADASPSGKAFFVASAPLVVLFKYSMGCLGAYQRFFVSILWIGVFSFWMVEWATVVGDTLGIPSVVMGLTFLAAGTSVPDLLSSVIVARQGHGDMAVSSSVGSNIFDVLFGLPIPWLAYAIYKDRPVLVCAGNLAISIMVLIGMIIVVVAMIHINQWRMTKSMGYSMFASYGVFVAQDLVRVFLPKIFGGDCV
jgi:K+-dependent Na+/Ca+ exchanger-like protein